MDGKIIDSELIRTGLAELQRHGFSEAGIGYGAQEIVSTSVVTIGHHSRFDDILKDGEWVDTSFRKDFPAALLDYWLMEVREELYVPGKGAWKTFRIFLYPSKPGRLEVFDREILTKGLFGDPADPVTPASGEILKWDLIAFPRTVDNIPDWMWTVFRAEDIIPPFYNPAAKTVIWDNKRLPVTDKGTDITLKPTIIDPSKEPGFWTNLSKKILGK
ncbi:hypothetical protein ACIQTZ_12925 [Paenarthrobacter sp. NPDC090520]|uniref:hypothetical protein n=1 Tax=Paenarthrobacter sp. NPDC090520 TaxID=3364382 RepID=UPI00381A3DA5